METIRERNERRRRGEPLPPRDAPRTSSTRHGTELTPEQAARIDAGRCGYCDGDLPREQHFGGYVRDDEGRIVDIDIKAGRIKSAAAKWCSAKCKQAAYRERQKRGAVVPHEVRHRRRLIAEARKIELEAEEHIATAKRFQRVAADLAKRANELRTEAGQAALPLPGAQLSADEVLERRFRLCDPDVEGLTQAQRQDRIDGLNRLARIARSPKRIPEWVRPYLTSPL